MLEPHLINLFVEKFSPDAQRDKLVLVNLLTNYLPLWARGSVRICKFKNIKIVFWVVVPKHNVFKLIVPFLACIIHKGFENHIEGGAPSIDLSSIPKSEKSYDC